MNSVTQVWAEDDASQELLRDILEQVEDWPITQYPLRMRLMDNRIYFPRQLFRPQPLERSILKAGGYQYFKQVLEKKIGGELKFSQHAQERLKS